MASFRQRNGRWQARVTVKGFPTEVRTFASKTEALHWARQVEVRMSNPTYQSQKTLARTTLKDLLDRYLSEITPTKKSATRERDLICYLKKQKLAHHAISQLTPSAIAAYRDHRLRTVAAATLVRELSVLSSVINHARREWGVDMPNPCELVRKPNCPPGRERVLEDAEEGRLLDALSPSGRRSKLMLPLVQLALATAMRRGELLSLTWSNIDITKRYLLLPTTKNGASRKVPLSGNAIRILQAMPRTSERVFPMEQAAVHAAFKRACKRGRVVDLRFHDLRHTATNRMSERLPNVIELASVTGHKSLQMLKRYYHPSAEKLAEKLG